MSAFVGVDMAKNTFDVATPLDNGKHRTKGKLSNDAKGFAEFESWLQKHATPDALIVIEATGNYHEALADFLFQKGYRLHIANPATTAAHAKSELSRNKTDKTDAKLISDFAMQKHRKLRLWVPEPQSRRRLRALVRRLEDLNEIRQMEKNRLEVASPNVVTSIESVIAHVSEEITETERAIKQHIDDDPDLRGKSELMTSIDGIGEKTAALILAELGDPLDYDGPKKLSAFAGLSPRQDRSGGYVGATRISRTGSSRLRGGLYMPAIVGIQHNEVLSEFAKRLKANGKAPKQVICAVMRKILHLVYGVLKSNKPFDPEIALAA
jgi:transposase